MPRPPDDPDDKRPKHLKHRQRWYHCTDETFENLKMMKTITGKTQPQIVKEVLEKYLPIEVNQALEKKMDELKQWQKDVGLKK